MTKQEAIQAKQDIEKAFEEISDRMCALRLQYPELGMLASYRFAQHSFIDNKGCVPTRRQRNSHRLYRPWKFRNHIRSTGTHLTFYRHRRESAENSRSTHRLSLCELGKNEK